MKIIVVGGTGTIGKAVVNELKDRHEIIVAGSSSGDISVDINNPESIEDMYKQVGPFDAVVATTGKVHFEEFSKMDLEKYYIGIESKLLGQVNLVLIGRNHINDKGSFTLISGVLNHDPIPQGTSAAMINGALDGFVKATAIDMINDQRINIVSPTVITEAMGVYAPYFRGYKSVAAAEAALAYAKSVEGLQTGQVFKVGY